MAKVTLDMSTFKALASDSRLSILKILDGKKMSLKDISAETDLNKATLHEHLNKLNEAGLVKRRERDGHKWVYYCLTWKGECLLHPENTRIVVMFSAAFFSLLVSIVSVVQYVKGRVIGWTSTQMGSSDTIVYSSGSSDGFTTVNETGTRAVADSLGVSGGDIEMKRTASDTVNNLMNTSGYSDGTDTACEAASDSASGGVNSFVSSNMVIWHDPLFQTIAVICFVAFVLLIGFAVWRYFKNKDSSL
jgi:predicted transcriptional regulator